MVAKMVKLPKMTNLILLIMVSLLHQHCASSGGEDEFADNIDQFNDSNEGEFENNVGENEFANDQFANNQFANNQFANNQFANEQFSNNNLGNFENASDGEEINSAEDDFNQFAFNNPGNAQFNFNSQFENNQAALFENDEQSNDQGLAVNNTNNEEFDNLNEAAADDNNEANLFAEEVNGNAVDFGVEEVKPAFLPPPKVDPDAEVKYILPGGSDLYQSENGAISSRLQQGDHPLVFGDGEWLRTSDGYYIPFRRLSENPIGRRKERAIWSP
jgi:hypothetical protein